MLHFFKNKDNKIICQLHVNTLYHQKATFHLFLIFISCIIINMIIILQIGTVLILRWQKLHSFLGNTVINTKSIGGKKKQLMEINLYISSIYHQTSTKHFLALMVYGSSTHSPSSPQKETFHYSILIINIYILLHSPFLLQMVSSVKLLMYLYLLTAHETGKSTSSCEHERVSERRQEF